MMRWRPWPPIPSKKFRVRLVVQRIEGLPSPESETATAKAEVKWKGPRAALRRAVRRNCTREAEVRGEGVAEWNEEFESVCGLTGSRDKSCDPWEIGFEVSFTGLKNGQKEKAFVIGRASLDLVEFTTAAEEYIEINFQLSPIDVARDCNPSLHVSLSLLELRSCQNLSETQKSIVPAPPLSPSSDALSSEKDGISAFKAGFRKVKSLTELVSTRKSKTANRNDEGSEGRFSARSDDAENAYPFDTDSLNDDSDEGEVEGSKNDSSIRKSFSYGTLTASNFMNRDYEDLVYYSSHMKETTPFVRENSAVQTSKTSILPWKKRKFSFRSSKAKGEPLIKRSYGEEGGDDIDYDRRQLSSSDESISKVDEEASVSEFGDDNFEVGSWESKELVSRDGHMKLSTRVFFASIDQRSERAAGESACTVLVAVMADWFRSNENTMPIKSQLDSLIREGSLEWRKLCENEAYREQFPDKHFDLETVLQAKIRCLSIVPEKSFIGFFHPEAINDSSCFDFLHGAMSFDSIWDEISLAGDGETQLYVVSWNDHFFVLKVERDTYYIIDTLGERLYEGCSQAYILKFDENTLIHRKPSEELVFKGKDSCKEYIKIFLAAIPIRELQDDIKKGLMASTPLHQRLQIEFHFVDSSKQPVEQVGSSEAILILTSQVQVVY